MLTSKSRILLVDDDAQALESTRKILELSDYDVTTACDGQAALDQVRGSADKPRVGFDLILTDVRMPRLGGLEFLRALSLCGDGTPVILMTAFGRIEEAVWAMKFGAVDFLTKPFKRQALLSAVEMALKRSRNRAPARSAQTQAAQAQGDKFGSLVGNSGAMNALQAMIRQVAPTAATVLITGESGTGKELIARCIHDQSSRAKGRFIAINCAAVPEQLIESELFGFEKGAFTGATTAKEGLFEAAHEGTLFLDEIGDMPIALQAKLLRTLQEGEVRRVGATTSKKINVRVIAATHRDLKENVRTGSFRQDLLYRLEVIAVQIPPLRDRMEDVPDLAYHFLKLASGRHGKPVDGIEDEAMEALLAHTWPGNVRELGNVVERGVVFAQGSLLLARDLPPHLLDLAKRAEKASNTFGTESTTASGQAQAAITVPLGTPLKDVEDLLIRKTLEATSGDKNMTAKLLGINSRTIYRKLEKKDAPEVE
ncbi:MAG: sigma-54-dependent transcriptional regulator [Bdellovibrionia bacterium]